ncbi:hypothetical protein JNB11_01325 [Kocuria palustris]|nr:hypothetical protein [Kocuria palustris]
MDAITDLRKFLRLDKVVAAAESRQNRFQRPQPDRRRDSSCFSSRS